MSTHGTTTDGWTPGLIRIEKPDDNQGPEQRAEGHGWIKGAIGLLVIEHPAVNSPETSPLTTAVHLPTQYPVARFEHLNEAAQAFDMALRMIDWSTVTPATFDENGDVERVVEAWQLAGFKAVTHPMTGLMVLTIGEDDGDHTING